MWLIYCSPPGGECVSVWLNAAFPTLPSESCPFYSSTPKVDTWPGPSVTTSAFSSGSHTVHRLLPRSFTPFSDMTDDFKPLPLVWFPRGVGVWLRHAQAVALHAHRLGRCSSECCLKCKSATTNSLLTAPLAIYQSTSTTHLHLEFVSA